MTTPNFLPVPEVKYTQKSPILGEFEVSVHGSLLQSKMQDAFARLQKKVKMPGFREGKVPLDLVKKRYHEDVLHDVFNQVVTETYRKAAPLYGSPRAMAAKIYWDDFNYWSFVCQYFFRRIFALPDAEHDRFEALGQGFAAQQFLAQKLLSEWARRATDEPRPIHITLPPVPSMLANLHLDLVAEMSVDEVYAYIQDKLALSGEVLDELVLRALAALGPEVGADLARAVDLAAWPRRPSAERLAAQALVGGQRRRALPPVVRDMERCLGRMDIHPDATALEALIEGIFGVAPAQQRVG